MTKNRAIPILGGLLAAVVTISCDEPIPPALDITVTTVSPASGPLTGETSVTITGTNFVNVTSVTIGGSALGSRTVVSPTQISGTTTAATSQGAKDVVVTSSSYGSGTCSGCFSYNPAVNVTAVSPSSGPLAGGTSITITGTNFINVTSVTIGGNEVGSRTVVSPTQVTGTTPAATGPGARDVVVTSSSHGSGTCRGCFTDEAGAPTVTAVSPAGGPLVGGTTVTITGTNFIDVTSVTIGGNELGSRFVVSPTRITGTTPAAISPGAKDVVVTSSSQGSGTCSGCFGYVATDGQLAFTTYRDGSWEIFVMNADGSGQVNLTNNPAYDDHPVWSPDGTKIAFQRLREDNRAIYLMNADGSGQVPLTNDSTPASASYATWSPDGSKIAFSGDSAAPAHSVPNIYVMNADGSGLTRLTHDPASPDYSPLWSPDGTRIAFSTYRDRNWEIYVINANGSGVLNLTNNPALDFYHAWSPDGTKIAFVSDRNSCHYCYAIYVMNADGSGQVRLTDDPAAHDYLPVWSPDGTKLAFDRQRDSDHKWELYVMNADGSGQMNLTKNPADNFVHFTWSPDGTRIAFECCEVLREEIYLINADGSGRINLTNYPDRDGTPVWRPK